MVIKMAQHQHILCGGGGGRSSKPGGKPKKVPQRGLGVAQLEKIRVEEQRKKLEALESANETIPLPISIPCLHPASSPSNLDGDKHLGLAFWPQSYGSSSIVPQRMYDFHNSGLNSPIEPPSNQSSGYAHTLPGECCKISGMKRPCPFPLEDPPGSLHGHFHPFHRHRETMSKYMSSSSNQNRSDSIGKLGGDFLTLAPPLAVEENVERKMESPNRAMSLFPVRPQTEWGEGGKGGDDAIDLNLRL